MAEHAKRRLSTFDSEYRAQLTREIIEVYCINVNSFVCNLCTGCVIAKRDWPFESALAHKQHVTK